MAQWPVTLAFMASSSFSERSNKVVDFWETILKAVLRPPQACTHMHQNEHAHPRMSSLAKSIISLAPFQSCRLLALHIKAGEFVLCPSSRKCPSLARLQRDRISDTECVCSCLPVQLGPQAQSRCFWKQGCLACSSSDTLTLIHRYCPRLGMCVFLIHLFFFLRSSVLGWTMGKRAQVWVAFAHTWSWSLEDSNLPWTSREGWASSTCTPRNRLTGYNHFPSI